MLFSVKAQVAVKGPDDVRSLYEILKSALESLCEKVVKLGSSYLCSYSGTTLLQVIFLTEIQRYEVVILAQSTSPTDLVSVFQKMSSTLRERGYPIVLRTA
ncbi:MAG: hypothetical protein ACP5HQ_04440 [Thermoprotei archaeon]